MPPRLPLQPLRRLVAPDVLPPGGERRLHPLQGVPTGPGKPFGETPLVQRPPQPRERGVSLGGARPSSALSSPRPGPQRLPFPVPQRQGGR